MFKYLFHSFEGCTTLITFDDIPGQSPVSGVIYNGYKNLNWTNARYVNASTMPASGYQVAQNSPSYVADNPTGGSFSLTSANGTSFAFDSLIVVAGWRDNLQWTISAYRLGTLMIQGTFSLLTFNQTIITCGSCTNLDTLTFISTGGLPQTGLAQNGTQFVLDNLCISFGY